MAGFRKEAVDLFRLSRDNRLVLVDGADLQWILDGRMGLSEALREKVRAASIQGDPFLSLLTL